MIPPAVQAILGRVGELRQPPVATQRFTQALASATADARAASASTGAVTDPSIGSALTASPDSAASWAKTGASGAPSWLADSAAASTAAQATVAARSVRGTTATTTAASATPTAGLPAGATQWMPAIRRAAANAGIDPNLLTAVVWTESSFHPDAVSKAGAIGLAQLMPSTAAGLGVEPTDPVQNLDGASRMLAGLTRQFGQLDKALAAYNVGPNALARGLARGTFPGKGYADTVLARYRVLSGQEAS